MRERSFGSSLLSLAQLTTPSTRRVGSFRGTPCAPPRLCSERLPPWSASPARPVGNPLSDREAEIDQDRSRLHQASLPVRPRRPAKCQVRHHRAHTVLRAPLRSRGRDRGRAVDGDAGRMARRTRAIRRGGLRRVRAQPSCPRDQRRHQSSRGPRRGGDLTSLPPTAVGATSASRKFREASSSPATPSAAPTRSTARE